MRICFLSRRYFPAVSGMSVYARNMTKALSDRGHEVVMISQYREDEKGIGIYGGGEPPREPWMEVHGLRSFGEERARPDVPADFEQDLRDMVNKAVELHREKPFDLVHAQYCYPNGTAALEISKRLGIPNVVSIQGGDGHWVGLCCKTHKQAMLAVLNHAMSLIIGSESFAEEVTQNHGTPAERFTIIPGATNTERFQPFQKPGSLRHPVRLLYHGRVDQRKGVLDFIYMGHHLEQRGYHVQLLISGIGPDMQASRDLSRQLDLEDRVTFMGYAPYDRAHEVYRAGDIFLSPTYAEGFSNTILEAMACGLPIVSTRSVGVVDCLTHDRNALLVEPGHITQLTDATQQLIDDRQLRERLAEAALQEVHEKYSWKVVARQIEAIYQQKVGERSDDRWTSFFDVGDNVESADLSCRFRAEPHLL